MADILVDSSVWIEYFRSGQGKIFDQLDQLLDEDRVVLCGFVELEIIQGIRLKERDLIEGLFKALPYEGPSTWASDRSTPFCAIGGSSHRRVGRNASIQKYGRNISDCLPSRG